MLLNNKTNAQLSVNWILEIAKNEQTTTITKEIMMPKFFGMTEIHRHMAMDCWPSVSTHYQNFDQNINNGNKNYPSKFAHESESNLS